MLKTVLLALLLGAVALAELSEDSGIDEMASDSTVDELPTKTSQKKPNFFPMPPFLKHCTLKARGEYIAIVMDYSLTRTQLYKKLEQWKEAQPKKIQKEVDQFNAFMKRHMQDVRKNATHSLEEFPQVLKSIDEIVRKPNVPRIDIAKKVYQILKGTDRQTAELTVAFMRIFTGHRRCPHDHLVKYNSKEIELILKGYEYKTGTLEEDLEGIF
ncbi:unnamed protein product, partial [Mesorhabditis spiculigera]